MRGVERVMQAIALAQSRLPGVNADVMARLVVPRQQPPRRPPAPLSPDRLRDTPIAMRTANSARHLGTALRHQAKHRALRFREVA